MARGAAAALLLLVGWLGQMVNGHLYHIGIRLISTVARGDDDETRLGQLLAAPLSWASFALFQVAVASRARALIFNWPALLTGAAGAMGANATIAGHRAISFLEPPIATYGIAAAWHPVMRHIATL